MWGSERPFRGAGFDQMLTLADSGALSRYHPNGGGGEQRKRRPSRLIAKFRPCMRAGERAATWGHLEPFFSEAPAKSALRRDRDASVPSWSISVRGVFVSSFPPDVRKEGYPSAPRSRPLATAPSSAPCRGASPFENWRNYSGIARIGHAGRQSRASDAREMKACSTSPTTCQAPSDSTWDIWRRQHPRSSTLHDET